jgi:hypothetical protein
MDAHDCMESSLLRGMVALAKAGVKALHCKSDMEAVSCEEASKFRTIGMPLRANSIGINAPAVKTTTRCMARWSPSRAYAGAALMTSLAWNPRSSTLFPSAPLTNTRALRQHPPIPSSTLPEHTVLGHFLFDPKSSHPRLPPSSTHRLPVETAPHVSAMGLHSEDCVARRFWMR